MRRSIAYFKLRGNFFFIYIRRCVLQKKEKKRKSRTESLFRALLVDDHSTPENRTGCEEDLGCEQRVFGGKWAFLLIRAPAVGRCVRKDIY